jgi:glycosyltransferase involved in cell wall biosynthesis
MAALQAEKLPVRGKLAGPFNDSRSERAALARLERLPNVKYVGPKYGEEKDRYFAGIDALIFPTRYRDESEPIVSHEAMSRGIPVIAYGRGCIPEILGADSGKVVDPAEPFVPAALAQIKAWLSAPAEFEAASRSALQQFSQTCLENEHRWKDLTKELLGGEAEALPDPGAGKEETVSGN